MSAFRVRSALLPGLALVAVTFMAYLPALEAGFVWDDDDYVTQNRLLRSVEGLGRIWTDPLALPQYYPLVHTTFWIEWQLWGDAPGGYHLVNVLLHAANAWLAWRLLRRLAVPGAFVAALVFALHPVHVESVAWITERKNVLSALCYLLALGRLLTWQDSRPRGRASYLAALGLFTLALLAKTVACTLPAAFLLLVWWRTGRVARRDVLAAVPLLALGLAAGLVTVWLEHSHVGAAGAGFDLAVSERMLIAGRAPWFYLGKLLWPAGLAFSYARWELDASVWWQPLLPVATIAVLCLLVAGRRRWGRGPATGALFFVGSLSPALGFVSVYPFRYAFVADHFQYVPSLGIIALGAAALASMERRRARIVAVCLLTLALGFQTRRQTYVYVDPGTLWKDTLAKNPTSWMAHVNLGRDLLEQGRVGAARRHFQQALRLEPAQPEVHTNLGLVLVREGRHAEARARFQRALELDPQDFPTLVNLGHVLSLLGQQEDAVASYERALALRPRNDEPRLGLVRALLELDRRVEAREQLRLVLERHPRDVRARALAEALGLESAPVQPP